MTTLTTRTRLVACKLDKTRQSATLSPTATKAEVAGGNGGRRKNVTVAGDIIQLIVKHKGGC